MDHSLQNAIRESNLIKFIDLFSKIKDPSQIMFNTWIQNQSLISYVLYYKNHEFLNFLLNHPQALHLWKDGFEMTYAVIFLPDAIPMLIKHGFNINSKDGNENTPIVYAVAYNKINVVKTLIEYHVQLNTIFEDENTLLHIACELRTGELCYMCLKLLLANMKPNLKFHKNKNGDTFLDIYIKSKFIYSKDDCIIYKFSGKTPKFCDVLSQLYKLVDIVDIHKNISKMTQHLIDWGVRARV